jgi:hypothetical protein
MVSSKKKSREKPAHVPDDNLYDPGEPIVLRTVDELHEKAKRNHHLSKELHNLEAKSSNMGTSPS